MGLLQRRRDQHKHPAVADLADARVEAQRLRDELQRARAALDGLPIGVVLVDTDGNAVANNAVARTSTAAGHAGVLVHEAVDRRIAEALVHGESAGEVELFGPPKRVLLVRAVRLDDGGALATIDDVSERKRLDSVRTDFVANISHELKTPVGAIALLAEAIVDEDDIEVVRRLASKMVDEAHRAATAIDDLLELSRIELDGHAVRERVQVAVVLRDAVVRSLAGAEHRSIHLDVDEPMLELAVVGDRRQLVSAVSNLIDNAVKYSEPGGDVRIATTRSDGMVGIVVTDFGIGIPARDLDRIFERFYRVDRARSRETGGTGLGLAIVRHVATNHNGVVGVQSVEGEGSTFTLSIPEAS